ncbi:MAG: ATPase, partial [Bacteroidetes bacterium]|nr:ATPase [Bacteroidota bacterium]
VALDVADAVILMDGYVPKVVTDRAREIAAHDPNPRVPEAPEGFGGLVARIPLAESFNPYRGQRMKVRGRGVDAVQFGQESIDLDDVEQLVDPSQSAGIANMLLYAVTRGYFDNRSTLAQVLERIYADVAARGLDVIAPFGSGRNPGDYAIPRPQDAAAAINRLRTLVVRQTR